MSSISLFKHIEESDITKLINRFEGRKMNFKKGRTIMSNMSNVDEFCVILSGSVDLLKYDIDGNLMILENLHENDLFGSVFSFDSTDISAIATSDCEIIFFSYNFVLDKCIKKEANNLILFDNMFKILNQKITTLNTRIDILTKRSIREKLLKYFEYECSKRTNNSFTMPFTFSYLASYLCIDRSAMMREIKHLKEEGFLTINKKRITITKY